MNVLLGKRSKNSLQNLRRDGIFVKRHIAVGCEDVLMMQRADGVQRGRDGRTVAKFRRHKPLCKIVAVAAAVWQCPHLFAPETIFAIYPRRNEIRPAAIVRQIANVAMDGIIDERHQAVGQFCIVAPIRTS